MTITSNYTELIENDREGLKSRYPDSIYAPIHYILSLPAKRIRPALSLLAAEMFGEISEASIKGALGIELFHNFTLMHDDIMDQAPKRRGNDSVHIKWNINQAILSGDAMMVMAYDYIDQSGSPSVFSVFNKVAKEVCIGQQQDMEFESSWNVSVQEYLEMIKLKTSVLLGASLKIGAILGGAKMPDYQKLYEFGVEVGLAFQIQDDYLDLFGNEDKVGKKSGGDIIAKKKTILILKTIEDCDDRERQEIFNIFNNDISASDLERVKSIMINNSIPQKLETIKMDHLNNARSLLEDIEGKESKKEELWQIAQGIVNREF